MSDMTHLAPGPERPGRTAAEITALVDAQLSRKERFRYLALAIAGAAAAGLIATLWLTEETLPLRTHVAFAALCGVGLAWVGVSVFVLTRRRPLYGSDRVLASGLAVLASATIGSGATAITALRGGSDDVLAVAVMAGTLLALAVVLHLRDRQRRQRLLARRRQLEAAAQRHADGTPPAATSA